MWLIRQRIIQTGVGGNIVECQLRTRPSRVSRVGVASLVCHQLTSHAKLASSSSDLNTKTATTRCVC